MSQEQMNETEQIITDPTFVAKVMQDNRVLGDWVIGLLEGCEGCTDLATQWAEGQRAMRSHIEPGQQSEEN